MYVCVYIYIYIYIHTVACSPEGPWKALRDGPSWLHFLPLKGLKGLNNSMIIHINITK